jgi:hypothetical protein
LENIAGSVDRLKVLVELDMAEEDEIWIVVVGYGVAVFPLMILDVAGFEHS